MAFADYMTSVAITLIGMVYPGYQSFKAVKRADVPKQQAWLKYWLVLAVVSLASLIVEPILATRVPLWNFLKIGLVAFLSLPMTNGYEKIYHLVLEPQLHKHEKIIDETAANLYAAGETHARNLGPAATKFYEQGKTTVQNTLNKKTS